MLSCCRYADVCVLLVCVVDVMMQFSHGVDVLVMVLYVCVT